MSKDYTGTGNLELMAEAVNYNDFLLSWIRSEVRPGDRILDVGAGVGNFASALSKDGLNVLCVEPDPALSNAIACSGLAVCSTVSEVEDSSVDLLYALNVLEHVEDDISELRRWRRKLRPGGRMLLYVPAFQVLFSAMDRKVGHFRRYRRRELSQAVASAGFRVRSARYVDCAGFFASLLYRMIGGDTGDINRRALLAYDRFVFPVSRMADALFGALFGKNVLLVAD